MQALLKLAKPVCHLTIASFLSLGLHVTTAQAAVVSTERLVTAKQAQQDRTRVQILLKRSDIKKKLRAQGVTPDEVQARVNSMTDTEVIALADRLERLPAGKGVLEVALIAFIVLLITDALGVTDIFPFIKGKKNRK